MNAYKYQGIPPRQTAAQRAERVMIAAMGREGYAQYRAEREAHYRDLIRQARAQKAL